MNTIPKWVDYSIFCGWTQYVDENGEVWRRENDGTNFNFFKEIDGAFILQGSLHRMVYDCSILVEHERFLGVR